MRARRATSRAGRTQKDNPATLAEADCHAITQQRPRRERPGPIPPAAVPMPLIRISQLSIVICLAGLLALLAMILVSQAEVQDHHHDIETLMALDAQVHRLSFLGQAILRAPADPGDGDTAQAAGPLQEFRRLATSTQNQLIEIAGNDPAALASARQVGEIAKHIARLARARAADSWEAGAARHHPDPEPRTAALAELHGRIVAVDQAIDGLLADAARRDALDTKELANAFAAAAATFGLVCLWAFGLIHRRIAGPVVAISLTVQRLRAGEASARAEIEGEDELGQLAQELNTLAEQRQRADALVSAQRAELQYQARMLEASQRVARVGSWRLRLPEGGAEWSRETYRIFGVSPAEFTPTPAAFLEAIHPEDREAVREGRERALSLQAPYDIRARIVRPDGAVREVHLRAEVQLGDDGRPSLFEGVVQDITDLRQAEAELREQSYLLETAGRLARIGGWAVDLPTGDVVWSGVVAEIHGQPRSYAPSIEEGISFYAPEDRPRIRAAMTACAERGVPFDEELQIAAGPDKLAWVRVVGEPQFDHQGRVRRVHGAIQEITEQKEAQQELARLSERVTTILSSITDAFFVLDRDWRFEYMNFEAERLLRRPRSELMGRDVWEEFPEAVGTEIEQQYRTAMREHTTVGLEVYYPPLECWFGIRAYPSSQGLAVYFRDITEHRRLVERLEQHRGEIQESRDQLAAALDTRGALINALPAQIALLDRDGVILEVNERWHEFGMGSEDLSELHGVGSPYVDVLKRIMDCHREKTAEIATGLDAVLAGTAESFTAEYRSGTAPEERWFRVLANSLTQRCDCDGTGRPGAVIMHMEITESKRAERALDRLAYEDALTGRYSRHGFIRVLQRTVAEDGWRPGCLVAMLDIERQRDINEAHGYEAGDSLLVAVGHRLQDQAGAGAIVARTGNDEFAVYLPDRGEHGPGQLRSSLQQAFDAPFNLGHLTVRVSARFGFSQFGTKARSVETLLREAEVALTQSMGHGAATTATDYTRALGVKTQRRVEITHGLRRALEESQFRLHFQPKVDLRDCKILQGEALIRWEHPEAGLLPPGKFIPIAEQSQLIAPIGRWTIYEACRVLRQWIDQGLSVVPIAVNVSLAQFTHDDVFSTIHEALQKYALPPSLLSLEITESIFHRESDELHATLWRLRRAGVGLALDDFGTGYSSLLYLQRYPFDEIKVDQGFVARILEDPYSREIVLTVLRIATALGAEAMAEGIESEGVTEELLRLGCLSGQGFYYSRPQCEEDFCQLLRSGSCLPNLAIPSKEGDD